MQRCQRNTSLLRAYHVTVHRWAIAASLLLPVFALAGASRPTAVPVLGAKGFGIPSATGWGSYKPKGFFNGGDPSGSVVAITWKGWGQRTATGTGRGFIFMPTGGYYPGSVKVDVRAFDLGHCTSKGPLAYEHLDVRYPSRPGGRLGKWTPWSRSICASSASSPSSTTTTSARTSALPCRDGQISVSDGGGGAGLGHEDQVILFSNQSQATCVLSGYPGVAGLDAQGDQVVQARRTLGGYLGGVRSGETAPPPVRLAPGQTASAMVEGTDNPVGSATSCPYYPALLVTPPNLTGSVRVHISDVGTDPPGLPGCSPIEVHPVVPGSSGSAP
jgi:hypothetical protein